MEMENESGAPEASADAELLHDPLEGITPSGIIITGARRDQIAAPFRPILDSATDAVRASGVDISVYVYGSVATGMARLQRSDVDLFTVGLPETASNELTHELSTRFRDLCRAVNVAAGQRSDYDGDHDEAYGNRVFLRHYCVHLSGPDLHSALPDFAADAAAARGFNGDIAQHAQRWRAELARGKDPLLLSRRLARKCLFAVAGLVSVHDHTWTTDRRVAAARWAEVAPTLAEDTETLLAWGRGEGNPRGRAVEQALDGVVARIVDDFKTSIGLWEPRSER